MAFARVVAAAGAAGATLQRGWAAEIRQNSSQQHVVLLMPDGRPCRSTKAALQRLGLQPLRIQAPAYTTAGELRWAAAIAREHGLQLRGLVGTEHDAVAAAVLDGADDTGNRPAAAGSATAHSLAPEGALAKHMSAYGFYLRSFFVANEAVVFFRRLRCC